MIRVNDDGDVIGLTVGDSTLEKIRNAIQTDIIPRIIPKIGVHVTSDNKKYIEITATSHGVPTIVSRYGREAFHITENGVKVTIPFVFVPRFVKLRRSDNHKRDGLSEDRRIILEYLKENPYSKLSELSNDTRINLSNAKRLVVSMKKEGHLRNDGNNRRSIWVVL